MVLHAAAPASEVDLAQEPSYALITAATMSGTLTTPLSYGYSAQDLIYGSYSSANPGAVPLTVLCQTTSTGQPVNETLLAHIVNPRIVIPHQEPVFDSLDPFFVADPRSPYLVQPHYYTVSSSPQELDPLGYAKQWATRYEFETFYHPYARTFLRELEIGGIPQLMSRNLQLNPQTVRGWPTTSTSRRSTAPAAVATPYPGAATRPIRAPRTRPIRARRRSISGRLQRRLFPVQLGGVLPRADVRRVAADAEPAVPGCHDLAGVHLQSDRQQRRSDAAALLGNGAVQRDERGGLGEPADPDPARPRWRPTPSKASPTRRRRTRSRPGWPTRSTRTWSRAPASRPTARPR